MGVSPGSHWEKRHVNNQGSLLMLQEPAESAYDLRFELFGFPVRVSWSFWIGALIFGFGLVDLVNAIFGPTSPGKLPLLLLWAGCMLVSILIHELGHAFAFRQYGIQSSIVLYHFGGLAVPTGSYHSGGRAFSRLGERQDLWIAFAGPLAQIASAMILVGIIKAAGYQVVALAFLDRYVPLGFSELPGLLEGQPITNNGLFALVLFYTFPSVLWALLNLVPVWPLDGGRILNSIVLLSGGRRDQALWVSVIAAGLLAMYGFRNGQTFLAILFVSLAISNYQMLQQSGNWRF